MQPHMIVSNFYFFFEMRYYRSHGGVLKHCVFPHLRGLLTNTQPPQNKNICDLLVLSLEFDLPFRILGKHKTPFAATGFILARILSEITTLVSSEERKRPLSHKG